MTDALLLNLGCGPDYRPGWLNLDSDASLKADGCCDVSDPDAIESFLHNQRVRVVYLKHVLEHFPIAKVPPFLVWARRRLEADGQLVIDGPDLRAMCEHLSEKPVWNWQDVEMIYGGQKDARDFHCAGWGPDLLSSLLKAAGFSEVAIQRVDLCFIATGRK